jgi:hypothetical protein
MAGVHWAITTVPFLISVLISFIYSLFSNILSFREQKFLNAGCPHASCRCTKLNFKGTVWRIWAGLKVLLSDKEKLCARGNADDQINLHFFPILTWGVQFRPRTWWQLAYSIEPWRLRKLCYNFIGVPIGKVCFCPNDTYGRLLGWSLNSMHDHTVPLSLQGINVIIDIDHFIIFL